MAVGISHIGLKMSFGFITPTEEGSSENLSIIGCLLIYLKLTLVVCDSDLRVICLHIKFRFLVFTIESMFSLSPSPNSTSP